VVRACRFWTDDPTSRPCSQQCPCINPTQPIEHQTQAGRQAVAALKMLRATRGLGRRGWCAGRSSSCNAAAGAAASASSSSNRSSSFVGARAAAAIGVGRRGSPDDGRRQWQQVQLQRHLHAYSLRLDLHLHLHRRPSLLPLASLRPPPARGLCSASPKRRKGEDKQEEQEKKTDQARQETTRRLLDARETVWTAPNLITMSRIAASPLLSWSILEGHYDYAVAGLAVAAATDWLDGYIAKNYNQTVSKEYEGDKERGVWQLRRVWTVVGFGCILCIHTPPTEPPSIHPHDPTHVTMAWPVGAGRLPGPAG
jgi:hypothetical protein